MISAIVDASGGECAPTLAALVPAAADGFVREVIVADPRGSTKIGALAEDAGARVAVSLAGACEGARQGWLLLLRSGTRVETGWSGAAWRHINDHADRAGWFALSLRGPWPRAAAEEAVAALLAASFGRLRAEHALLLPRRVLAEAIERGVAVSLPLRLRRTELQPIRARVLAEL